MFTIVARLREHVRGLGMRTRRALLAALEVVVAGRAASHSSERVVGRQVRAVRSWHVVLITAVAAGIALLGHAAPLTYDEAFNRLYYGKLGVPEILRTYDSPNNHIPFTVLQSFIPDRLLAWDPWTIRILGVASGIVMVAVLIGVAAARHATPLLGLFVVVGSPILVTYLFVSRGYTFSAVLLVVAAALPVVLGRRDPVLGVCLGASALALATWTIPTNAFMAPGWVMAVLAIWGLRAAIAGATVYTGAVTLIFSPIAGQVYAQSKVPWTGNQRLWPWFGDLLAAVSLVPVCLVLVGAVAAAAFVWEHHHIRSVASLRALGAAAQLGVLASAMSVCWFGLTAIAYVVGVELPFVRTAVPAMWIGVVAVVATFPRGRLEYIALVLLVPGLVSGAIMWSAAVRSGEWEHVTHSSRNDVLYGTTPATIRDLPSIGADRIVCSAWDENVCQLVAPNLAGSGVTVEIADVPYDSSLDCVLGSRRPLPPWQVSVYRQGALLGVLCH